MAETNPPKNDPKPTPESNTVTVPKDELAQALNGLASFLKGQAESKAPPVPTEGLFDSRVPNGVFKVPNFRGTGFTYQNCHGDEVDANGKIIAQSESEGVRAMADV